MATKIVKTRLVIRNDNSTVWSSKNPILLKGELGIEEDTRKFKIGDGVSNWNSLLYANITDLSNYYTKSAIDEIVKNLATVEYVDNKVATEIEKIPQSGKVAALGEDGKIIASQLPSYVDDVIEGRYNQEEGMFYVPPTVEPHPIPLGKIDSIYFNFKDYFDLLSVGTNAIIKAYVGDTTQRVFCTFSSGYYIRFYFRPGATTMYDAIYITLMSPSNNAIETFYKSQYGTLTEELSSYKLPDDIGEIVSIDYPDDEELRNTFYNFVSDTPFSVIAEKGKIYVDTFSNKSYRWGGTTFVEISQSLALGTTSNTAYAGSNGQRNADNIKTLQDTIPTLQTKTDNTLQTTNKTVVGAINELKQKQTLHDTNIQTNINDITKIKQDITAANTSISSNFNRITDLEGAVDESFIQIEELNNKIETGGTGGGSSDFIDVEELPEIIIDLPATPYPIGENVDIDRIYFNTALSIDEVKNIIFDFCEKHNLMDDRGYCSVMLFSGYNNYTTVYIIGSTEEGYAIRNNAYPSFTYFWCDEVYANKYMGENNITKAGWQDFKNPMPISGNITTYYGPIEFLSITPFGQDLNPNIKNDKIYRLFNRKEAGWKGTPIRNSGILNRVYHNRNLSVEEVEAIINTLDFEYTVEGHDGNEASVYNVIDAHTSYFNYNYSIYKDGNKMYLYSGNYVWQNEAWRDAYGSKNGYDYVGWIDENSGGFDTIDFDLVKEVYSANWDGTQTVGTQNDKLSAMLSETPFEYVEAPVGYYRVINDEWVEVLNNNTFKTVDSLPPIILNTATEVPDQEMIEKVYVNTSLSNEEILEIAKSIEYVNAPNMGTVYMVVASADSYSPNKIGFQSYVDEGVYVFAVTVNGATTLIWNSSDGWVNKITEIAVGYENTLSLLLSQHGGTNQNDKLKNLISVTPFETKNKAVELDKIYRVPVKSYGGTTVPNSGTVNKVYFNTNLTDEQVETLLSKLTYDPPMGINAWLIVLDENGNPIQSIVALGLNGAYSIVDYFSGKVYWANQTSVDLMVGSNVGWQTFDNPIEINSEVASEFGGMSIGVQNELIKDLFSTTPFENQIVDYKYHRIIDGKFEEVLGKNNIIDVDKLPGRMVLTEVPNNGYVEKVYFNTSLSDSEVEALIDKCMEGNDFYDIVVVSNDDTFIDVYMIKSNDGRKFIYMDYNDISVHLWCNDLEAEKEGIQKGWQDFDNPIEINSEVLSEYEGTVGVQNDKLKNLISATPFDLKPEADLFKIYRVPVKSCGGTTVPNSGTVDKVYFNTSLSDEEVEALIDKYTEATDYYDIILVDNSDRMINVYMEGHPGGRKSISWDGNEGCCLWCNNIVAEEIGLDKAGWQDFPNPIEINAEVMDRWDGNEEPTIGIHNHELINLASLTPFTQNTEVKYHRVINGKWVEVLNNGGGLTESDVNQLIANYMSTNYDNGDTEEF